MKPFEKWQIQEVELTFGIKKIKNFALLDEWLAADEPITPFERDWVERMRLNIEEKGKFWNEDELKFQFISPYLSIFDFKKTDVYTSFSQRILSTKAKDVNGNEDILRGRVEWFVAKGKQIPLHPIFFIHEYKPALKSTPSDPLGQLMIAMYASQILNKDDNPLYGIYVLGEFWYFVVLKGSTYAESRAYDMTQAAQIEQVTKILKRTKIYIEDILGVA
jgi:hypothetical protein